MSCWWMQGTIHVHILLRGRYLKVHGRIHNDVIHNDMIHTTLQV